MGITDWLNHPGKRPYWLTPIPKFTFISLLKLMHFQCSTPHAGASHYIFELIATHEQDKSVVEASALHCWLHPYLGYNSFIFRDSKLTATVSKYFQRSAFFLNVSAVVAPWYHGTSIALLSALGFQRCQIFRHWLFQNMFKEDTLLESFIECVGTRTALLSALGFQQCQNTPLWVIDIGSRFKDTYISSVSLDFHRGLS